MSLGKTVSTFECLYLWKILYPSGRDFISLRGTLSLWEGLYLLEGIIIHREGLYLTWVVSVLNGCHSFIATTYITRDSVPNWERQYLTCVIVLTERVCTELEDI